jgi:hypothetical protein
VHLTHVVIKNYRAIRDATVEFQRGLTIVVGDLCRRAPLPMGIKAA